MAMISDLWDDARWEVRSVERIDDRRALAVVQFSARGSGSGVEVAQEISVIYTIRDGMALRAEAYLDPHEARAAAGLEGPG
jgi:ketosteroid isomerase-like protein